MKDDQPSIQTETSFFSPCSVVGSTLCVEVETDVTRVARCSC